MDKYCSMCGGRIPEGEKATFAHVQVADMAVTDPVSGVVGVTERFATVSAHFRCYVGKPGISTVTVHNRRVAG